MPLSWYSPELSSVFERRLAVFSEDGGGWSISLLQTHSVFLPWHSGFRAFQEPSSVLISTFCIAPGQKQPNGWTILSPYQTELQKTSYIAYRENLICMRSVVAWMAAIVGWLVKQIFGPTVLPLQCAERRLEMINRVGPAWVSLLLDQIARVTRLHIPENAQQKSNCILRKLRVSSFDTKFSLLEQDYRTPYLKCEEGLQVPALRTPVQNDRFKTALQKPNIQQILTHLNNKIRIN